MSTDQDTNLDALLEDDTAPEAIETPETEVPEPQPEQESHEQPGELEAAPPAEEPVVDDGPMVPRRALEDERRKRQEYEKKLQDYNAWMMQQQQGQQWPPAQPEQSQAPDPWEDPEGALRHQQETLTRQFEQQNHALQQQLVATRVETSRQIMRSQHEDYEAMEQLFDQAAQQQPHLLQQAAQHPFPAQFAYEIAKQFQILQHFQQNPDAFTAYMASNGQGGGAASAPSQPAQPSARVPRSLASKTSNAPRARNEQGQFVEQAPLDDLLDG